jgi:hypothetical protein
MPSLLDIIVVQGTSKNKTPNLCQKSSGSSVVGAAAVDVPDFSFSQTADC